jgi:hypothetical protein
VVTESHHFFNLALKVSAGNDLKVGKAGKLVKKRIIRGILQGKWNTKKDMVDMTILTGCY